MCNYSTCASETRDAVKGDNLVTFGRGLFDAADHTVAVCLKPGTEIGFDEPIKHCGSYRYPKHEWNAPDGFKESVAILRVGLENLDVLEFADGSRMLLSNLSAGQKVKVLQLPVSEQSQRKESAPVSEREPA
jgi:hypothetical protein